MQKERRRIGLYAVKLDRPPGHRRRSHGRFPVSPFTLRSLRALTLPEGRGGDRGAKLWGQAGLGTNLDSLVL